MAPKATNEKPEATNEKPGAGVAKQIFGLWGTVAPALGKGIRAAEPHIMKLERVCTDVVVPKVQEHQHILLLVIGLVVNFQGNHFSKLIIASQTLRHMDFSNLKTCMSDLWVDIKAARGNLKKAEEDLKDKTKGVGGDASALNEALKQIDPDKFSAAVTAVWKGCLACFATLGNSIAQACAIGVFVTKIVIEHADAYLKEHAVYEGLDGWVNWAISAVCHTVFISLAWITGSVGLSIHHVALGSSVIVNEALALAEKLGTLDDSAANTFANGPIGHGVRLVLALIGFYWQMSDSGLGIFALLHLPFLTIEAYLNLIL